jgi:hypothetical protein
MVTIQNSINNTIGDSNSGATDTLTVQNTSNTASSQAKVAVSVAGDTAGDCWDQWAIGTSRSYAWGISNATTNNNFRLTTTNSATLTPSTGVTIFDMQPTVVKASDAIDAMNVGVNTTDFTSTATATDQRLDVTNKDNSSANSYANLEVKVGGSTAGDPQVHVTVQGGNSWAFGLDNSDNDSLYIGSTAASASLANPTIYATVGGLVKFPMTSAFLAYVNTVISNVTGDGTAYTIIYDTKNFDLATNFSTGTGLFTAPISGRYLFTYVSNLGSLSAGVTVVISGFIINGTTLWRGEELPQDALTSTCGSGASIMFNLSVNDTVGIQVQAMGGTKTANVRGVEGGVFLNHFSGRLVC